MKSADELHQNVRIMRCKSQIIAGKEYVYKFKRENYGNDYGYGICVEGPDEKNECFAGSDRRSASALFKRVYDGEVTPCTLNDVIEDYFE